MTEEPVRFGVMLPTFADEPSEAFAVARKAEELGLDGVFVYDHLWPMGRPDRPALAPFPILGALSCVVRGVQLGTLVARVGLVPEAMLVGQFLALHRLAPGRVIAAIGTGDHLSFNENNAYGVAPDPAQDRRAAVGRCAAALLDHGLQVWIGGRSRATIAVAEATGAVPNLWQAGAAEVAVQASRTAVSWAGMAGPPDPGESRGQAVQAQVRALVGAGASWLVFGWPVDLLQLSQVASSLR
ncbi:MAG: LLM class flavin-dependent oxidoreductase [Acidimicrobiales bacterium]